jgi:small subunit ribosomal protein S9
VARVRIKAGKGDIVVNDKSISDYFSLQRWQAMVTAPLRITKTLNVFDVFISLHGSGITSQAGAASLGIARALLKYDIDLMEELRKESLLTRDSRMKERKKYGRKGARKGFQFSKR